MPSRRLRGAIACLAVTGFVAAAVYGAQAALNDLAALVPARLDNWSAFERALNRPGSGRDLIDVRALAAVTLLDRADAKIYRLSAGLAADDGLQQRILELSWPRVVDPNAAYVLRAGAEHSECATVAAGEGVILDHCD